MPYNCAASLGLSIGYGKAVIVSLARQGMVYVVVLSAYQAMLYGAVLMLIVVWAIGSGRYGLVTDDLCM